MAAQPSPQHPRYTAVWVAPDGSLNPDETIHQGDDENAAIAAALEYDAPAAGHVEIRHYTPAGTQIGIRRIDRDDDGNATVADYGVDVVLADPDAGKVEPRRQNVETEDPTPVEQPVDEPPAEDETETTRELEEAAQALEAGLDEPEDDGALFDASQFDSEELALPRVDGISVAKIALNLQGGLIWLDRSSAEDVAIVRDLHVGQRVRLVVEGVVGVPKPGYTTSKGGELDVIYLARNFKAKGLVQAVSQPADEEC